jgi:hypothetical protein
MIARVIPGPMPRTLVPAGETHFWECASQSIRLCQEERCSQLCNEAHRHQTIQRTTWCTFRRGKPLIYATSQLCARLKDRPWDARYLADVPRLQERIQRRCLIGFDI